MTNTKITILETLKQKRVHVAAIVPCYDSYVVCFGGHAGLYLSSADPESQVVSLDSAKKFPRPLANALAKHRKNVKGEKSRLVQHAVARLECLAEVDRLIKAVEQA